MAQVMQAAGLAAAVVLLLVAAWQDFTTWKIRNWTVLSLVAAYALVALGRWLAPGVGGVLDTLDAGSPLAGDLAAGALLFAIGVVLWLLRLLGAGDAKLFLPIGLFVGLSHLLPFALALIAGAIVAAVALRFPVPLHYQTWPVLFRIDEIRKTGKVPYGVIMVAAAFFAMYLRYGPA